MNISEAKFRLYNRSPFFGVLIFNLPVIYDDKCPTMGVDGERLIVNQKYWDSIKSKKQQLGLLCHEVGHLFLGHLWRKKGRNQLLWNAAGDYVINLMIKSNPNFDLPPTTLYNTKYIGWSTEEVYEDLKKNVKTIKISGKDFCDKSRWYKGKGEKAKQAQAKWKQIGKQAMHSAKEKGDIPAGLERLFEELEPKENWRMLLMQYAQPFSNDYSFNPVDRRFLEEDFLIPSIDEGQKLDWIAVAIDTSGSISQLELNAFIGELKGIMKSFDKVKVKLTFCDADATPFIELNEFEQSKIKPTGGGGTDFRPVFKLVEKENNNPLAVLYFTDTQGEFPSKEPDYDTIWISTTGGEKEKVPWGKLLPYTV